MRDLAYNIDFEVAAFFFAVLLYVETAISYPRRTRKNRIFRVMTIMVIITQALDILSAITITYASSLPRFVNVLVNSGYFMAGLLLCFMLHYYIQYAVVPPGGKQVLLKTNRVVLIVMETSIVVNAFVGYYFFISPKGAYLRGPLFLVLHCASLWFVTCASAVLMCNRKLLKKTQFVSSILFIALYFVAVALQTFVFTDVLLIMPAVSAMLIIAIFSLETPDFAQLQTTLHELTKTKRELEQANEKYYCLAYNDMMTGLKNRAAYTVRLEQLGAAPFRERVILLIADINNLKLLNDNFGHAVGDDAIVKTARLLKTSFAEGSQCYRIGGDEFAVIAYDLTQEEFALDYARFTQAAAEESARSPYPFSVATGYQRVESMTLQEALKEADQKMYENKAASRRSAEGTRPGL